MHFSKKNYLKNNYNHTTKQAMVSCMRPYLHNKSLYFLTLVCVLSEGSINICVAERVPQQQTKKEGGGEDISSIDFLDKIMTKENMIHGKSHESVVSSPLWSSKAMIESVNEVCRDTAWGERREIGRTGLALQDYIFRDLIEEIVKEMGFDCIYQLGPLPFESCKKRLSF
jgi:hypothetical protein